MMRIEAIVRLLKNWFGMADAGDFLYIGAVMYCRHRFRRKKRKNCSYSLMKGAKRQEQF